MRLLLDTHVVIWWVSTYTRIPKPVRDLISAKESTVHVSAATAWEIAIKYRLGKLHFDPTFLDDFDTRVRALAFEPLSISSSHAVAGARLAGRHGDPFDRLLVGQTIVDGLTLVSADQALKELGAEVLW